jgi:hypothetical protein
MNWRAAKACLIAAGILILTAPAWADSQLTKTLKLGPNGRFVLDASEGGAIIMGSDQPGAIVVVTSTRDDVQDRVDFNFEENPGMVRLTARRRTWHLFDFFFERRRPKDLWRFYLGFASTGNVACAYLRRTHQG